MLTLLLTASLLAASGNAAWADAASADAVSAGPAGQVAPGPEPDGSRSLGIVPPFQGEPAAPAWLRSRSHELAALDCRHYAYEVYADGKGAWLVRYVSFPDADEAFREIEQAFLFSDDPLKKPVELKPAELQIELRSASWAGRVFKLVDKRDLLRP